MINQSMAALGNNRSTIRELFEYGNSRAAVVGRENVFDFSIGNPNVPAPDAVRRAILEETAGDPVALHGYTSAQGAADVRRTLADDLNRRFGTRFQEKNILMTVGAASGLNVALKTLLNPGDEVITFAPYFVEYGAYVGNYDGKLVVVSPDTATFQPNLAELEEKITPRTKAVIINTPHNPTGVIYSENTIKRLAAILEKKEKEYGTVIFLISDEPYRELAYDGAVVPYVTKYYANTIVGYSFSKSLSLPGERIGYLVIPDELEDADNVIQAAAIATRVSGAVNAPSLMQLVIARCVDESVDVEYYDRNRNALYLGLTECGFSCTKPQGAFYLFVKSPFEDETKFCEMAKRHHILMVPGSSFACPGYVRLAYCVSYETIQNSLPAFRELAKECFSEQ